MAALTLVLAAQTPPPQQDPPAHARTVQQGNKNMATHNQHKQAPDLDLIGYLGDYDGAADGLDPVGLAEHGAALASPKTPPKPAQDTHP